MSDQIFVYVRGKKLSIVGTKRPYLDEMSGMNADDGVFAAATADLPAGALYLDVGANIGVTAVTLAARRPDLEIVAFEPVPENAECLRRNVQANDISNVRVVEAAVSDKSGVLSMTNEGPWSSVMPGGPLKCRALRLDDEFADKDVSFVKVDTEGFEPNVFGGARELLSHSKPLVFTEFNAWWLIMHHYDPIVFSWAIYESFEVLFVYFKEQKVEAPKSGVDLVYENIMRHQCSTDVLLRPRSRLPPFDETVYTSDVVELRRKREAPPANSRLELAGQPSG